MPSCTVAANGLSENGTYSIHRMVSHRGLHVGYLKMLQVQTLLGNIWEQSS